MRTRPKDQTRIITIEEGEEYLFKCPGIIFNKIIGKNFQQKGRHTYKGTGNLQNIK